MAELLATKRTQRGVLSLGGGAFNGKLRVEAIVDDPKNLTFYANVTAWQNDTDSVQYTPCSSNGKPRKFGDLDDCVKWLRGAYVDMSEFSIDIQGIEDVTRTFKVPTDALKDATSNKAKYSRYLESNADKLEDAELDITRAEALGYNAETAHEQLQALHADYVGRKVTLEAEKAYFQERVTFYQSVIDLG